jgi:enhancer of yellow 2 transcription factor
MEAHIQSAQQKLIETGERERLKDLLAQKLIESGWEGKMKEHASGIVRQKGPNNIKFEDLINEVRAEGLATVPHQVKVDMLSQIRKFLDEHPTSN